MGVSRLRVHLVFDSKLDLTCKARLVADGNLTPDPIDNTTNEGYNLRRKANVDYKALHNIGETQLHQMQQKWMKELKKDNKSKKVKKITMKGKDTFQNLVGIMMMQMSKMDKYAQVSVKVGIRRH